MRILFAVASYLDLWDDTGKPRCPEFCESLAQTLELCQARGHEPLFIKTVGNCYIQMARNEHAKYARESKSDVFFQLDDDISWRAEDAIRLCEMEDEVVCGVYRRKRDDREDYPIAIPVGGDDRPFVRTDGCILADFIPTGFLAIKTSALERIASVYPERSYQTFEDGEKVSDLYDFFPQGLRGGRVWGEDFAFSQLWRDTGGEIWISPDMTITHWRGRKPYKGNFHEFLLKQPGGSKFEEKELVCG